MFSKIVIPTDGSELSEKAIDQGLELAKLAGGAVTIVRVTSPPAPIVVEGIAIPVPVDTIRADVAERIRTYFDTIHAQAKAKGVTLTCKHLENSQPWRAIVDAANEVKASLIVMASHGRSGVAAVLIGSETNKVLTHSKIPVLVVR